MTTRVISATEAHRILRLLDNDAWPELNRYGTEFGLFTANNSCEVAKRRLIEFTNAVLNTQP